MKIYQKVLIIPIVREKTRPRNEEDVGGKRKYKEQNKY